MKNLYSTLLRSFPNRIAESTNRYVPFCERHLQALWFEQKYFKNLTTTEGLPITVISPGLWNAEAGPDFKKAHLLIGTQDVHGDIEIHLSEEGWLQHQHHRDKRYGNVVFHLSLWKPGKSRLLSTMQGKKLFQAHMEPFFTIPRSRIVKLIDLDLYPYKTVSGSGHCSQKLFRKLSRSASKNFFIHAAEWRLAQKLNFLKANSENPDRCFSTGLAMGLGYKNNTRNFLKLYDILKRLTGLSEKELFAYSLGICGFFADGYKKRWVESTYYRGLLDLYEALPVQEVPHIPFLLHQIRPFNHPIRRIAYMIQMLKDPNLPQLSNGMLKAWREQWQKVEHQRAWKKLRGIFEGMIPKYQHSYWNRHFSFCSQPSSKDLPLLGGTVIQEILINAFLPILFEDIAKRGHPKEREAFYNFYASFPASRTSKSLYLKQRFFGDSLKGDLMKTAEIEQGAYQLHHDFCIHYEASCEGCPFIEQYTGR